MQADRQPFLLLDAAIPEQRAQWLDLWRQWPHQDVAAHPGYARLFARPEDRTVCACQPGTDGGILFPLIVRNLRSEQWEGLAIEACDLVSPYGYGGPFGWGSHHVEAFWLGFDRWAHSIRAVSLFTRLSLFKEHLIPFYGDTLVKGPCVVVSLAHEPEALLRSYDKTARENVRQAERAGVTIEVDLEYRRLDDFLSVYYSTMDRLKALPMYYFPKAFFQMLIAELSGQVVLIHALHQGRVVSTELLLVSEDHLYSFLGGTLEEGLPIRANPLLRHGVNLWGKAQGKRHVVLGGGYAGQDSLLRYKQRYAPAGGASFCVGTRILDNALYQALIEQRAAWESSQGRHWTPPQDFFPAYRG